jgi:hypothetical protein
MSALIRRFVALSTHQVKKVVRSQDSNKSQNDQTGLIIDSGTVLHIQSGDIARVLPKPTHFTTSNPVTNTSKS